MLLYHLLLANLDGTSLLNTFPYLIPFPGSNTVTILFSPLITGVGEMKEMLTIFGSLLNIIPCSSILFTHSIAYDVDIMVVKYLTLWEMIRFGRL